MSTVSNDTNDSACWSGVMAMTLCAFTLVTTEFMPVSLLTPLARSLNVSEGLAGQGITVAGVMAVITSILITRLAGNLDRKKLLLALTAFMAASGTLVALSTGYISYIAGRALTGIAIGGFWTMSAASAIRLVPSEKVSRALAIFNGGSALAAVIAAPLGSFLGSVIGWRGAFFALVPVSLCAFIWMAAVLPSMPSSTKGLNTINPFRMLVHRRIAGGILASALFFMGQFALFTYIRPFLENVASITGSLLSLTFLIMGGAGFAGTLLIGALLPRRLYPALICIPLIMALVAVALIVYGEHASIVLFSLGVWGLVGTAAPAGWWTWVAVTFPDNAETGGALMVAIVNTAIACGSIAGGMAFDHFGYSMTFSCSAFLLMMAAALSFSTWRLDQHTTCKK